MMSTKHSWERDTLRLFFAFMVLLVLEFSVLWSFAHGQLQPLPEFDESWPPSIYLGLSNEYPTGHTTDLCECQLTPELRLLSVGDEVERRVFDENGVLVHALNFTYSDTGNWALRCMMPKPGVHRYWVRVNGNVRADWQIDFRGCGSIKKDGFESGDLSAWDLAAP